MAEIRAAGAIMYRLEKGVPKYLILRSAHHGEWGPPKGRADPGETDVETALREIYEETGFSSVIFRSGFRETLSYIVNKKGRRVTKEAVYFMSEMPSDNLELSSEHTAAKLAKLEELDTLIAHDDLRGVFHKADAFIQRGVKK